MPNHEHIYRLEAEKYDLLVSRQPDLMEVIRDICSLEGLDAIDLGAGTGRLTVPIAAVARSVLALDASEAMLRVTADKLRRAGLTNWRVQVSDNRRIAAEDNCADVLVSGWSICYVGSSDVPDWERNVAAVMKEIGRVLRPGGTVILFETLGTGAGTPAPPAFLTGYYDLLEREYGFRHKWIRTDYRFSDTAEALELSGFFFGPEVAAAIVPGTPALLPECAGVWWRSF